MARIVFLFLSLVALFLCALGSEKQREFDYFILVRQWPGTICGPSARRPCKVRPTSNVFTIHGLWPQYNSGGWPEECTDEDFDPSKVEDLQSRLRNQWPSYYGANSAFWSHEWTKHGTCAKSLLPDERAYFAQVLDLNEKLNLTAAIMAAEITPGSDQEVRTATIAGAIKTATGAQPLVHCSGESVYEIWMCIDKSFEPFDCPGGKIARPVRGNSYCGRYVTLPSIDVKRTTRRA